MIFTPLFFAKIGLNIKFEAISMNFLGFGLLYVFAAIAGKFFGCGFGAKVCGFDFKESLRCGVGMMCRAEVCLICANKGIGAGLIDPSIQPFLLILILLTSFVTPMILKLSYKNETLPETA